MVPPRARSHTRKCAEGEKIKEDRRMMEEEDRIEEKNGRIEEKNKQLAADDESSHILTEGERAAVSRLLRQQWEYMIMGREEVAAGRYPKHG